MLQSHTTLSTYGNGGGCVVRIIEEVRDQAEPRSVLASGYGSVLTGTTESLLIRDTDIAHGALQPFGKAHNQSSDYM